jgi:hypothetical protein
MKRSSGMVRRASIAAASFSIFFCPQPSSASRRARRRVRGQAEEVGRGMQEAGFVQLRHLFLAQSFDVERVAADHMLQPGLDLGRADEAAGAAPDRLALGADGEAAAVGAVVGEDIWGASSGRRSSTTSTTCGITSPARWMTTKS